MAPFAPPPAFGLPRSLFPKPSGSAAAKPDFDRKVREIARPSAMRDIKLAKTAEGAILAPNHWGSEEFG